MRRWVGFLVVGMLIAVAAPASAQVGGASISGTVTDDSDVPLAGICVTAYGNAGITYTFSDANTASDGTYTLDVLPGFHRVEFRDCSDEPTYVGEWYDDRTSWAEADQIAVGPGQAVTGIDAELALGGSISGVVTNVDEEGLGGICVYADGDDYPWPWSYARTDASGSYTVGGLPTGNYRVSFYDCDYPPAYEGEFYDDKTDWWDADLVGVTVGEDTPHIDAELARLGEGSAAADLAVTGLRVENVPLRTDNGEIGHGGWSRKIQVDFENLSQTHPGEGFLEISVCPRTVGLCRYVGFELVDLGPGQASQLTVDWNGAGTVGDVRITAFIWSFGGDPNYENNWREVDHYVIVGGTGFGAGV